MKRLGVLLLTILTCGYCFAQQSFVVTGWKWPIAYEGSRATSYPYITGDTFRALCDFVIDEKMIPFDPSLVKDGDLIFINPHYGNSLELFFTKMHPRIKAHYILVTHNGDDSVPGKYVKYLNHKKLLAWFGVNAYSSAHSKMFCLPTGIGNKHWPNGDEQLIEQKRQRIGDYQKTNLLYLNFSLKTNIDERTKVFNLFKDASFCKVSMQGVQHQYYTYMKDFAKQLETSVANPQKLYEDYLHDLASSKFVLSPEGAGIDCYRTWEALLLGAIPIVKHSAIDKVFDGLPVLLINDWQEVTQEFLEQKYQEMSGKTYAIERLFADYWFDQIQQVKLRATKKE